MIYRLADNIISPLGETTEQNYQAVKAGRSALRHYDHQWDIPEPFTASLFTEAQNEALAVEGLTRFESLAYTSARKAIEASKIDVSGANVVFILSTTKGNIELIFSDRDDTAIYPGTAARHIAERLGIKTSPIAVCNACISGVSALVLALRLLEAGQYDYAVVCGADVQNKFTVSGFQSLKAISENECKPFDIERMGLNLGEAAATLVLSRQPVNDAWAIESGAVRNDAFHISSPSKHGDGARMALNAIVKDTDKERLAFINAHGTATMFNDQMESVAITGAGLGEIPVNAYKGYFGHTLGAAGILETVLSMAATDDHTILATRGFEEMGVSGKVQVSAQNSATDKCSFVKMISGFGGCNGVILASRKPALRAEDKTVRTFETKHRVQISPSAILVDGKLEVSGERSALPLATEGTQEVEVSGKSLLTAIYKRYVDDYPKFYKMDPLSRLGFVATELLLKAEGKSRDTASEDRAVILFNRSSSIQADQKYLDSIIDPEDYFPSPSVFVYTLPNIVTGEIAMRNLYHGETSFYITDEKDDELMKQTLSASFADTKTKSIIGGWIDYQDDSHFEADIYIVELTNH